MCKFKASIEKTTHNKSFGVITSIGSYYDVEQHCIDSYYSIVQVQGIHREDNSRWVFGEITLNADFLVGTKVFQKFARLAVRRSDKFKASIEKTTLLNFSLDLL